MENGYSYYDFFRELYRKQGQKYKFNAKTQNEFAQWRDNLRDELKKELGLELLEKYAPEYIGGTRFRKLDSVDEEDCTREKFVLDTLPGVSMPFYVLTPHGDIKDVKGTMLALPSHGSNKDLVAGVTDIEEVKIKYELHPERYYGRELVKRGYRVLCPDTPGYGERIERVPHFDRENAKASVNSCLASSCKELSQTAEALGLSLTALQIWDLMRLVDFAYNIEGINKKRLGCVGFSGGGHGALWLAAMDDRINVAVVGGYIHGYFDSILDSHMCPCNYAPKLWNLADISDIASMIAPRFLLAENGTEDNLNGPAGIDGPASQMELIKQAYRLFDAEDNIVHNKYAGGHIWPGTCYKYIDKWIEMCDN